MELKVRLNEMYILANEIEKVLSHDTKFELLKPDERLRLRGVLIALESRIEIVEKRLEE